MPRREDYYTNEKGSNISTHYEDGEASVDGRSVSYSSTHYNENTDGVKYSNVHFSDGSHQGERWESDRYSDGKFTHDD